MIDVVAEQDDVMRNDSATTVWGRAIWAGVLIVLYARVAMCSEGRIVVSIEKVPFFHSHSQLTQLHVKFDVEGVAPQICTGLHIRWQSLTKQNVSNTINEDDVILFPPVNTPFSRDIAVQLPKNYDHMRLQISPRFENDKTKFTSDFFNFNIEHKSEQLLYLIATVMGCAVGLAGIVVWRCRGRIRLHLSTCIHILVSTGILLLINSHESYMYFLSISDEHIDNIYLFGSPGWPLPLMDDQLLYDGLISKSALAIDTGVFVGVLMGVAVVSEYLIRQRSSTVKTRADMGIIR